MASPSEQNNLWDTLYSDDDDETQKDGIPKYTGTELAEISPSEMVAYDMNNEKVINHDTDALTTSLGFCEQIVIAAYKVAEYVPDLSNDKYSKFWKQDVIPNLVESLTQDLRARSIIVQSFSSIRDLSITIQKAAEIVKQTKGSPKAIEIAQKNIPGALKALEKCIEDASTLSNTAIETFATQTEKILEIIGPEAVKFVDQKVEIECQLKHLYDEQQKLCTELGEKQGEVSRYSFLMSATEKHLYGAKQELEETKRRTDELNQLNVKVEQTIQNIPVSTSQTVTTKNKRRGMWFWIYPSYRTTKTVITENPNREEGKKYYESIILSRMGRIQENQNDEAAKQKVMNYLNESLSEHKSKYERAMTELKNINEAFEEKMKHIQVKIDKLHKKIEEIDKNEIDTQNMIGLQGNTLIQCLIAVKTYGKTINGGASAYFQLVSILKGIKAMVQNDVELLSSSSPSDIFLAGNHLLKEVQFLSSYSVGARRVLQVSAQYKSLAIEYKTKGHKNN